MALGQIFKKLFSGNFLVLKNGYGFKNFSQDQLKLYYYYCVLCLIYRYKGRDGTSRETTVTSVCI